MKRIRMNPEAYEDGSAFSVTVATTDRQPFLADGSVLRTCLAQLRAATQKYGAALHAYCFMPDHVHLLVSLPGGTSLVTFMRHFKQLSGYRFQRLEGYQGRMLWQRRFYDHALRREEDIHEAAEYIWSDPVRQGIVGDAAEYQYSGSLLQESEWASGSEDPDLPRSPPRRQPVGEGLQTLAARRSTQ